MSFILVKDYEKHHILIRADMIWVIFVLLKGAGFCSQRSESCGSSQYGHELDGAKCGGSFAR